MDFLSQTDLSVPVSNPTEWDGIEEASSKSITPVESPLEEGTNESSSAEGTNSIPAESSSESPPSAPTPPAVPDNTSPDAVADPTFPAFPDDTSPDITAPPNAPDDPPAHDPTATPTVPPASALDPAVTPTAAAASPAEHNNENHAKSIPILTYHHILNENENTYKDNRYILSTEAFSDQMHLLKQNGYHTITMEELEDFLAGKKQLPAKSVMITFDDGYKSNFSRAYPILKELGFKSSIFMITASISEDVPPFDPALFQFGSWQEMNDCSDVFEYGSHTHDLHSLDPKLGAFHICKPEEEIEKDLATSRDLLETKYFAYPYGSYKSKTIKLLQKLGFSLAFSTKEGYVSPGDNKFTLKRWSITPEVNLERFKQIIRLDGNR